MSFNLGDGFNKSPFNVDIISNITYSGLVFLKCANWAEGPNHGGIQTEYTVDTLWDYISEYENTNGASDYRKGFIYNSSEESTGACVIRGAFIAPNAVSGRLNSIMAVGTASDNMSNKPLDTAFGSSIGVTIAPGESVPIWIKRVITAGGDDPGSFIGIRYVLTVSET